MSLTGTWTDNASRTATVTDDNGSLTISPGTGDIWWSSASGSWQGGTDPESGDFQGKVTFKSATTTQDLIFCAASGLKTLVFSNGQTWTKS